MKPTKQFKSLQREWYKKLKATGFEDAEKNEELKEYSSSRLYRGQNNGQEFETVSMLTESKAEYYRLVGYFLYDHKFENWLERRIWKEHADGMSYRETSVMLIKDKVKCGRTKVWRILTKLKKQMFELYRGSNA